MPFSNKKRPALRKGKRLVAVLLCAALLCTPLTPSLSGLLSTPALAAEPLLSNTASYPDHYYHDVDDSDWFAAAVVLCYETGLMNGTGDNTFSPNGILTVGEVTALAARLLEGLGGDTIVRATAKPGETRAWYEDYVDYLARAVEARGDDQTYLNVLLSRPTEPVSRYGFLALLDLASDLRSDLLPAINTIQTLPDSNDAAVLRFYNAGILTGTDVYGTFDASRTLTRAEAAVMLARVADPAQRRQFTPQAKPATTPSPSYEEEFLQTEALRVNGISVNFAAYEDLLCRMILQYDLAHDFALSYLDWDSAENGGMSLSDAFKLMATELCVRSVVQETFAGAVGVNIDDLAAALTPDPAQEVLEAYVQENDLLAARHILIKTVDDQGNSLGNEAAARATAVSIIDSLKEIASRAQFEKLLSAYNEDPGMTQFPEGYLFTAGEMVSEFENAVRALQFKEFTTTPVKSTYGYHVILRLDPTTLSQTKADYQDYVLEQLTNQWAASATVTKNELELNRLDAKTVYTAFLQSLLASL